MAKLQLRLPESIHNKIRKIAKKEKISINQLLVNSISNEIIRYETMQFFEERTMHNHEYECVTKPSEGSEPSEGLIKSIA
ncbi:MAG: toxin-antitoxin system HicB family antitoxin [bacterium]